MAKSTRAVNAWRVAPRMRSTGASGSASRPRSGLSICKSAQWMKRNEAMDSCCRVGSGDSALSATASRLARSYKMPINPKPHDVKILKSFILTKSYISPTDSNIFSFVSEAGIRSPRGSTPLPHRRQHLALQQNSRPGGVHFGHATQRPRDGDAVQTQSGQAPKSGDTLLGRADNGEAVDEVRGQDAGLGGIAPRMRSHVIRLMQVMQHRPVLLRNRATGLSVHHREPCERGQPA